MVEQALTRLESGLQKIHETQEMVNEIARETKEAQERLKIAEKECDEALHDIQLKKVILAQKQETIQIQKIEIEKKEKVCKRIAIAAEEDLNAAMPALEEARKALEALNKRDIGEIKSYAKPPVIVEMVLEAVMILRNSEPSWAEAKRQLEWCLTSVDARQQSASEVKEIILDVHFPKQKNRRVIFQCGDRARLMSEHIVLLTATFHPQLLEKLS
ncbi:UNVERIFIED_CONTAM: Dnah2 [Trichonephila clavipes]